MNCKCRVVRGKRWNPNAMPGKWMHWDTIEFCPLHKSAEEMVKTLTKITEAYPSYLPSELWYENARKILKSARGE